jgi:hypothetical protein
VQQEELERSLFLPDKKKMQSIQRSWCWAAPHAIHAACYLPEVDMWDSGTLFLVLSFMLANAKDAGRRTIDGG